MANKIKWSQGARDVRDAAGIGAVAGMAMSVNPSSMPLGAVGGAVLGGGAQLIGTAVKAAKARKAAKHEALGRQWNK